MTAQLRRGSDIPRQRRDGQSFLSPLAVTAVLSTSLMGLVPSAAADSGSEQWYLEAMQAEEMWKVSTGKGITVAVVDGGVRSSTEALQGQVLPGKDVSEKPGGVSDDPSGHGTTMAELIAGSGKNDSLKGLAPGAKILPIRINVRGPGEEIDWSEKGEGGTDKGIMAAADSSARIINVSLGGEIYDPASEEAIKYALKRGKIVFVGAGNDGDGKNKTTYPASFQESVAVAAVDKSAKAAKFSQHGRYIDLAAPGTEITGWCRGNFDQYCHGQQGTSQATALASASAALIWSKHKDWTANQVLRVMLETAGKPKDGKVPSTYLGYGVVRPNDVLLEGKGDPGDPDKHPLVLPDPFETPSPSASAENEGGKSSDTAAAEKVSVADSSESDDGSLEVFLGVGAAVIVLGGGVFAYTRFRRS